MKAQESVRIGVDKLVVSGPLEIKMLPPGRQTPNQGGLTALTRTQDCHTRKILQILAEKFGYGAFHTLHFKSVCLKMQDSRESVFAAFLMSAPTTV